MNGAFLLVPIFLIRYGLLSFIKPSALPKAAHFAPAQGREKGMLLLYQVATLAICMVLFFLKVKTDMPWFALGLGLYTIGLVLFTLTTVDFAKTPEGRISRNGLYRFSRNPMYVAYLICFLGCALLTQSPLLFLLVCVFQASSHWVILSEERWCIQTFSQEYIAYMKEVRRYI